MSSETKTQVTFGKRTKDTEEDYQTINVNGKAAGYLMTRRTCNRIVSLSFGAKAGDQRPNVDDNTYYVYEYAVELNDEEEEVIFNVADYSSARSALAAAKRYAKETLSAPAPAPVEEEATQAPAEETLQEKVNALPLKSFKVLAAVIPAMYDNESSCYLEDVNVEGMSIHAITGTLPHLSYFIDCEDLAEGKTGGTGYLLGLRSYKANGWEQYTVYEVNAAIKARLTAEVKRVSCPLCGKSVKLSKRDKVSRHRSSFDTATRTQWFSSCNFSGRLITTPLEALRNRVEECIALPRNMVAKKELEVLNAAEEALEPLVKGLPEAPAEEEASSPVEEEARVIRVTPPQVDALRALGYEVKSCKLHLYPSQVEELLERLYAERETRTRGARRVYTSLIERVSAPKSKIKRAKGAPRAWFSPGDLRIEYTTDSAHRQLIQLVDAAEITGLISAASARALRASVATPRALPEATEEEYSGSCALARFMGEY